MSLKVRYYLRLIQAFIRRFIGLIVLGLFVGIAIFLVISIIIPKLSKNKDIIGLQGRYTTTNLPNSIVEMISSGLTKVNENGEIEPNLAKSWETADSGKTWVFKLDTSRIWQDGDSLSSDDVNYNFTDLIIERPDKETLIFKLQENYSLFPFVVSKPIFKKGLLGIGDWKVDKITLKDNFVDTLILVNENSDKKIYRFFPTEELAKTMFKLGKANVLVNIYNKNPFDTWKTTIVGEIIDRNKIVVIFFNTQDEILSDKTVRQALFYAIDKENFQGSRAISPISPSSFFYNPQVKRYDFSQERSKELIKSLSSEQKNKLKINLVTTPVLLAEAEKVLTDWKNVGVESSVLVSSVIPENFQAYMTILEIPESPDQYTLWHSTQEGTNISKYSSARIDKLLEEGRKEMSLDEERKIYLDFQRFILEDVPAAFLYHPTTYTISRK